MKKKSNLKKDKNKIPTARTVPVLYQNISGELYAFTHIGGELYFAKVPLNSSTSSEPAYEKSWYPEKDVA